MKWKQQSLADVSVVITKGTTPTTLGYDFSDEGIPFLRVQNIGGGRANYETETLFISEQTHAALSRSQIFPGDVLVSIAGTIGRAGIVPDSAPCMNCNQAVAIVRPSGDLCRSFLRHWLESRSAQDEMTGSSVTGTIANLSLTQLRNLQIPLPPLAEQKRIAAILDAADALRTKRREALAQLDALLQSTFLTLFGDPVANPMGWRFKTLDMLCTFLSGYAWKASAFNSDKKGNPVIRIQNVGTESTDFIFTTEKPIDRFWIKQGDLLLSLSGSFRLASWSGPPALLNQRIVKLTPQRDLLPSFFEAALTRHLGAIESMGRHALVNNVALSDLKQIKLISPPLPLQQKFAAIVESIECQKAAQRAHLAELDTLFAALQHRAFRGEL